MMINGCGTATDSISPQRQSIPGTFRKTYCEGTRSFQSSGEISSKRVRESENVVTCLLIIRNHAKQVIYPLHPPTSRWKSFTRVNGLIFWCCRQQAQTMNSNIITSSYALDRERAMLVPSGKKKKKKNPPNKRNPLFTHTQINSRSVLI